MIVFYIPEIDWQVNENNFYENECFLLAKNTRVEKLFHGSPENSWRSYGLITDGKQRKYVLLIF